MPAYETPTDVATESGPLHTASPANDADADGASSAAPARPLDLAATELPEPIPVQLRINGVDYQLQLRPWVTLLDLLRDHLDLTGTKKGCDHGQCGACTVIVDGKRINSCLALAVAYDCADITTVEGLGALAGNPEDLHPLQQAFIDCDAFQCGYCTPGQLCSAAAMLNEPMPVNAAEIRERMSGNICRCAAYPQILEAVSRVVFAEAQPEQESSTDSQAQGATR
ncbi:(2Fe-2S)-binding protein [Paracidovorax citrulli]